MHILVLLDSLQEAVIDFQSLKILWFWGPNSLQSHFKIDIIIITPLRGLGRGNGLRGVRSSCDANFEGGLTIKSVLFATMYCSKLHLLSVPL